MRMCGTEVQCVQWLILSIKFRQNLHKTVLKLMWDLGLVYIVCHCKDCKSIPRSLVFIHIKFTMASNLTKIYCIGFWFYFSTSPLHNWAVTCEAWWFIYLTIFLPVSCCVHNIISLSHSQLSENWDQGRSTQCWIMLHTRTKYISFVRERPLL